MNQKYKNLLWVTLKDDESFPKIAESLTRIGLADEDMNVLSQECYILHKQGKYAIAHYTELLSIDGYKVDLMYDDIQRRNFIADMLVQWNLCSIASDNECDESFDSEIGYSVKVIRFADKDDWDLISTYDIGELNEN